MIMLSATPVDFPNPDGANNPTARLSYIVVKRGSKYFSIGRLRWDIAATCQMTSSSDDEKHGEQTQPFLSVLN